MSRVRTASAARPSRPALTFYPAEVDGSPAAFVVDLEQEPRKVLSSRIVVAIPMRDPTEDGLRSEDEMGTLDRVQEVITGRLQEAYAAELVGFYDLNGATTLVFYARPKMTPAAVAKTIGDIGPYTVDVHVAPDPEWRFYIDVLFPDAYALQGIWNRALIDELESHGDTLEEPRDVDHLVTFPSRPQAEKAAKELQAAHFHLDGVDPDDEEKGRFAVTFHRSETLEGDKANHFSAEILDIVLPHDGEYDGWGAPAVGGDQDEEEALPPSRKTKKAPAAKKKAPAAKKKAPAAKNKAPAAKNKAPAAKKKAPAAKKKAPAAKKKAPAAKNKAPAAKNKAPAAKNKAPAAKKKAAKKR